MYYRVAIRSASSPTWHWKSTALGSLQTVIQFLWIYRTRQDQLRVYSSTSREGLAEQLEQENQGLSSPSVTAAHFLRERMLCPPPVGRSIAEREGGTPLQKEAITVIGQPAVNERGGEGSVLQSRGMSTLQRRREELESGSSGDHDLPYSFSLPRSVPQVLAWITLLARVQRGELHP
jgi:hypothetical protein